MKILNILPVESTGNVKISIVTEMNVDGVSGIDALICTKAELMDKIKETLVEVGVLDKEENNGK